LLADPRAERLLEIIKRLASEHELDRLLERITESAVDLSGAERGFVLLVDAQGQLEKHTVQVARAAEPDPHEAFSRSIAEAVLIDGEAIITVDATRDTRLSEYVSVHKLMLRSVACLPIRTRTATVGVLYLEHRRSRGRFSEASVELLSSFADQAAIALENARLLSENKRRQQELEALNAELLRAKQGLEELLTARTEQLAEAQRELGPGIRPSDLLGASLHGRLVSAGGEHVEQIGHQHQQHEQQREAREIQDADRESGTERSGSASLGRPRRAGSRVGHAAMLAARGSG